MIGIYAIKNTLNNKYYIGESINIEERWENHKLQMGKNHHRNKKLKKDLLKYGINSFEFIIIRDLDYLKTIQSSEVIENILLIIESLYMNKYDSINNGYNKSNSLMAKLRRHPETAQELMNLYQKIYQNNDEYSYKI
ncbi:Excinuclease ABC C subunit domain protein [Clostridium sp. DL-VIII]|uniref:GIY-YIG nuclease family protein n=1 Tax=Clostridium sp. DL-VIII TaxID=641107 RepID=UPI00023AF657|nr:GIY-YIG nuclease family protein [Clostridium sp. DL-VIII]EHI96776.1 Excinuclease ABC C subunit domain protein [Clostridium sp. DL-VIII]